VHPTVSTSVPHYTAEGSNLHIHSCENLKSHILLLLVSYIPLVAHSVRACEKWTKGGGGDGENCTTRSFIQNYCAFGLRPSSGILVTGIPCNSECYTPTSEPFRIYEELHDWYSSPNVTRVIICSMMKPVA
jgi:hypothetical protein